MTAIHSMRLMTAIALVAGCTERAEGTAPAANPRVPSAGIALPPVTLTGLLPQGARVEEQLTTDLDGDGVPEVVVLSSLEDADLAKEEGVTKAQLRMNLELGVHVFATRNGGLVELGAAAMTGGPKPLKITPIEGGGARRFVVASALHCGASCAGIELHLIGVREGRFEALLDRDRVDKGEVRISADNALEVREAMYSAGDEPEQVAVKVTRYVLRGPALVVGAQRTEPLPGRGR